MQNKINIDRFKKFLQKMGKKAWRAKKRSSKKFGESEQEKHEFGHSKIQR